LSTKFYTNASEYAFVHFEIDFFFDLLGNWTSYSG